MFSNVLYLGSSDSTVVWLDVWRDVTSAPVWVSLSRAELSPCYPRKFEERGETERAARAGYLRRRRSSQDHSPCASHGVSSARLAAQSSAAATARRGTEGPVTPYQHVGGTVQSSGLTNTQTATLLSWSTPAPTLLSHACQRFPPSNYSILVSLFLLEMIQ